MSFRRDVFNYLRAGFPALYVQTHEEQRAEKELLGAKEEKDEKGAARLSARQMFIWSATKGWMDHEGKKQVKNVTTPTGALKEIREMPEESLYVLRDFHFYMGNPEVIRTLRDLIYVCKATGKTIIIVAPATAIPLELEKDITVLNFNLPTRDELGSILDLVIDSVGQKRAGVTEKIPLLDAACGLTWTEAENVFALALVKHGGLSLDAVSTVLHEKANIIKKTGILEFYEPNTSLVDVGGLNELKGWLKKRARAFSEDARQYGLDAPRGVLLVGVQGCGKSLIAKAIAQTWRLPLVRFDLGRVFGGLVGQSEQQMRHALAIIDATAPNVTWVDEGEKAFAGLQSSGQTDAGVTARVLGNWLTWSQEKTSPSFIVMTCNDIEVLPPEMVRKGRFADEIFFVDLPTQVERGEIFSIHLRKRKRDPQKFDLSKLSMAADQFSGAEIEQAILSGMTDAFDEGKEIETQHILNAIEATAPLAQVMKSKIDMLRTKAKENHWREATSVVTPGTRRRIAVT